MKIKILIISLAVSLMSTKCAEEPVYITFENKSERHIVFSCTKNRDSLKKIILGKYFHDSMFKFLHRHSVKKDTLSGSDFNFYLSKNKIFYTFYFLKVIKYDSIKDEYVFDKIYDSINISKGKIQIGDKGRNSFSYNADKIIFKSKKIR